MVAGTGLVASKVTSRSSATVLIGGITSKAAAINTSVAVAKMASVRWFGLGIAQKCARCFGYVSEREAPEGAY
jgi:hypothetical protein